MLNEDFEIKTVPREISLQCQKFRNEKNLTQEQLAQKISNQQQINTKK